MASYIAKRVAARWLAASRIKVNPDGTGVVYATTYTPDDPEQFVEDVEAILALPQRLTRKDYERLARKYGVKAHADSEMGDYGDTEMNHIEADALLCRVLLHLGQKELVDEWYKVEKWFA